jgi:hypothetical protein
MKMGEAKPLGGQRMVKQQREIEFDEPLVMRVLVNDVVTYDNHFVPLVAGKNDTPLPCATTGCADITLPNGEILHSYPVKKFARFVVYDRNEGRPCIFECSTLIYDEILGYFNSNDWGDLTKYDLRITAVAQPGVFKRTY